jgi:hypothetical protein
MSNGLNKPTVKQEQKSLSLRVKALEENFARALIGINQRFTGLSDRTMSLEEFVEALMHLQGREDIEAYVDVKRIERARAAAAAEKESLDVGINEGYVVAAETAGDRSIVVGFYTGADGKVIEPGRTQLVMPGIQPQFRELLQGKSIGTKVALPDGGSFEVQAIYNLDEQKLVELQQKRVEEATNLAGAEAAADEKGE